MMSNLLENEPREPSLRNLTTNFGSIAEKQNEFLQSFGTPHIQSFNFMCNGGLNKAVADLDEVQFEIPSNDRITLKVEDVSLLPSRVPEGTIGAKSYNIFPSECKQSAGTYNGRLVGHVSWSVNGKKQGTIEKDFGEIPIMVKSDRCHLAKMSPKQLIDRSEHADEWGGYFIISGRERLIRMLIMTRRNFPITICRRGWKKRGKLFSDLGVTIRCVKEDESSSTNVLHFLTDGSAKLMFSFRRNIYYAPIILILKSLLDVSDEYILQQLTAGYEDLYFKGCIRNMLIRIHEEGLHSQSQIKDYIGKTFRVKMYELPPWMSNIEICDYIIKRCIAIHLESPLDKFHLLVLMVQKLFALVQGHCCVETSDIVMNQELLLGGHLYMQVVKERLQMWLNILKINILKKAANSVGLQLSTSEMQYVSRRSGRIDAAITSFIATGNIVSRSGLGLMQDKGLTIVVENINRLRYMSHFRSVHRGSFFQTMRTTESRQLLPDAWGFICPVHTPDGIPCGLLNHLTKYCQVTEQPDPELVANIAPVLVGLGMSPLNCVTAGSCPLNACHVVMLDGRVLGYIPSEGASSAVRQLRLMKIEGTKVPKTLEIALVPRSTGVTQYPGLFLFTGPSRMMRPVMNLMAGKVELVGTFEQVYLDICIYPEEMYPGLTTHQEVSDTAFLSNLACLIPMPDCNQSPRNMYQCQMGKQTMGTALHTWHLQAEIKMYRLQTPASPLFRPVHYDLVNLDDFAMGTNAIVAVISYTGYDMEDAMIINKASYERGLAHGTVYKSEHISLPSANSFFGVDPSKPLLKDVLDPDGFPHLGMKLNDGDPLYSYYDDEQCKFIVKRWKGSEYVYVDNVRLCGQVSATTNKRAVIVMRLPRNPSIGDKFASRAGQKGICSQKWPAEDLPFTETGLVPDIMFNPHGFPSRMTIAMMIEVMAGKSAAIHGLVHDATPFNFSEKDTAIDYFGKMLEAGGYNYYGTEKMYSGVDGREMNAAIFFGVVHYQRLRHMVSDKWQVRSTGPIDVLTHQPVKGRRRGGGIRFGEMERDSLLSHGASFLLQDRLFHCSDKSTTLVCRTCSNLLSPILHPKINNEFISHKLRCQLCEDKGQVEEIELPYIYRFLVTQLAAVNINLKVEVVEE